MDNNIPQYQPQLAKKLNRIALVFSVIVLLIVVSLRSLQVDTSIDFSWLAAFHSTLNAFTAMGLIVAYYFIKNKNVFWHKRLMIINMIFSGLFLLSYIIYHLTTPETKYCHEGGIRYFYLILLITHVVLAAVILPVILYTFIRAYTGQIELHRKLARWAYPLWLYIAISGPVIYLMLRSCM